MNNRHLLLSICCNIWHRWYGTTLTKKPSNFIQFNQIESRSLYHSLPKIRTKLSVSPSSHSLLLCSSLSLLSTPWRSNNQPEEKPSRHLTQYCKDTNHFKDQSLKTFSLCCGHHGDVLQHLSRRNSWFLRPLCTASWDNRLDNNKSSFLHLTT